LRLRYGVLRYDRHLRQRIHHRTDHRPPTHPGRASWLSVPRASGYSTCCAGDTLVVRWVDRLGRNYTDVVDTIREFMRRGVIIKTVINGMTFDGSTTDPMQQAVRDALIAFMAATAQAQAEATKSAQRAGIDHKRRAQPSAYLGRKPSYDRPTFDRIRLALGSASPPSLSVIAKAEGLSKQTVFRLKQDPQAALAALDTWGL